VFRDQRTLKYNKVGKPRRFDSSDGFTVQPQETTCSIRVSHATAGVLILLLASSVLHSWLGVVEAQPKVCHLDRTRNLCGVFLRPGVRDEYKSNAVFAWSHTLDTLRGAQGGDAQRRQVIDRFQDYAILASMSDSVGDFQFDLWTVRNVSNIRIYMPSNFTFAYSSSDNETLASLDGAYSVWTDITNDYSYISTTTVAEDDPIAPGWQRIEIGRMPTPALPMPSFMIRPGLHHIRLFKVRAPFTAGLYHFKIYIDGRTIGDGNFPVAIVKASMQPAYVTGRVLLRGLFPPTNASGRVVATGSTPLGRYMEAVAYFGPRDFEAADVRGSHYRYWLFGVPAGTYDMTASASGFLKSSSRIVVDAAQSLKLDLELERAIDIRVTVWSKCQSGVVPWGNLWQLPYGTNNPALPIDDGSHHRDILIRLIDQYEETVGYWASDDIDAPYGPPWNAFTIDRKRNYSPLILKPSTLPSRTSYTMTLDDVRGLPSVRLDGHVHADAADLIEGIDPGLYKLEIQVTGYVMRESDDWQRALTITPNSRAYALEVDLRRSSWVVATAEISNSLFVPVSNATMVIVANGTDGLEKGLAAGRFPAGAREFTMILEGFNGIYNQLRTSPDYQDYGLALAEYRLEVFMADMATPSTGNFGVGWYLLEEDLLDIRPGPGCSAFLLSFHLQPSSIELFLRSIRLQQPTQRAPWIFPGAGISVYLIDEYGTLAGTLSPLSYGLVQDDGTIVGDPYDIDTGPIGWHGLLRVLFTGIDPGPVVALGGFYPTHIEEGKYYVGVSTFGYLQLEESWLHIVPGALTDLQVDVLQGAHLRVELEFKHEHIPTAFNGFVRVEAYNQDGLLVGASIYAGAEPNVNLDYLQYDPTRDWKLVLGASEGAGTLLQPQRAFISWLHYGIPVATWANWPMMTPSDANRLAVPRGSITAFDVFGFHYYSGGADSRHEWLWANGWDTTNGVSHPDSGIRGSRDILDIEGWGNFTIYVWAFDPYGPDGVFDFLGSDGVFGTEDDYTSPDLLEGGLSDFRAYEQVTQVTNLEAPWEGTATVRITLEEQPSVLGRVFWTDMYGNVRTLPWAQVAEISADGKWTSTTTGTYRLWLSTGQHQLLVTKFGTEQLWEEFYFDITLPIGGSHTFCDVTLTSVEMVAPEFTSSMWTMLAIVIGSLVAFSRRQRKQ